MLPEGPHALDVYLSPSTGICTRLSRTSQKLLIDCSTIDTATSLSIKQHITSLSPSTSFYDSPVSGGVLGAQAGTLASYLGSSTRDPHLPLLTSLLSIFSKQIIPCGFPSAGLAAKLSNNYLSGVIAIAASEAFDMGMRSGLSPLTLQKVYAAGTAQNAICDRFCPVPGVVDTAPSSKGFEGGFRVELMRKDFGLAVEMAKAVGARNVLGERGTGVYEGCVGEEGCRGRDSRVVFRFLGGREDWREEEKEEEKNGEKGE